MKHSISTHHHRTRVLSLLCTFAIFASLIPVVSAEPQMVDLDTLKKHVVSNTVTPSGIQLNLFDYWIDEQTSHDTNTKFNDVKDLGINKDHYLKFFSEGTGGTTINQWTGKGGGVRAGIVKNRLSGGYPVLQAGKVYDKDGNTTTEQSLAYLFDQSEETTDAGGAKSGTIGKQTFWDVGGLLQIDDQGYYYYNADNRKVGTGDGKYQSANYAVYDNTTHAFRLYDTWGVRTLNENTDLSKPQGQFFPFNDPAGDTVSMPGRSNVYQSEQNGALLQSSFHSNSEWVSHYFGMSMTTRFVQRYNGMTTKGGSEPMTFQFSGDDDVWVFIDGVLVADLGGIHDQVTTSINFATGVVKVEGQPDTTLKKLMQEVYPDASFWRGDTLSNDTYHTLKLFYLERGGTDSNLAMKFNLAYVPETGGVKIDQDGKLLSNVTFALYPARREPKGDGTYKYTKTSDEPIGFDTTDEKGQFVLSNADDIAVSLNDLHKRDIKYLILEEQNKNRDGYRHDESIDLVLENKDVQAILLNDENHRWTTGTYAAAKETISTGPYITMPATQDKPDPETANLDENKGLLFGVIMRRMNNVGVSVPVSGEDEWGVVTGSALSGWQVTGRASSTNGYIGAALRAIQTPGNEKNCVIFEPAANGAWMAEFNHCPGDLRNYYYWEGGENTAYAVAFFYTTAKTIAEATVANTRWVDGTGFERQFAATIYIPNVQHHLYVKKVDDSAAQKPLSGAVFDLYTAESLTVTDGAYGINPNAVPYDTVTTGDDGLAAFPSKEKKLLAAGNYYLVERTAPAGHTVNPTPVPVIVDDTHGVMADAGTDDDGVAVTVAEGTLVPTMTPFATNDAIDHSLTDITTTRMEAPSGWNPNLTSTTEQVELTLDTEKFAQDGSMSYTSHTARDCWSTETGWLWFHITQTPFEASEAPLKTDLSRYDLTRLFSGKTTVVVTDQRVGSLSVTKVVENATKETGTPKDPDPSSYRIKITLKDASNAPLSGTFGGLDFGENGEATWTATAGANVKLEDLPIGTTWKVEETETLNSDNWETTVTSTGGTVTGKVASGKIENTNQNDTVNITNRYDNYSGWKGTLTGFEVSKSYTSEVYDGSMTFQITGSEGAPMPNPAEISITGQGTGSFGELTFKTAGTYIYTIEEVKTPAIPGMDYDDAVYTITVSVTRDTTASALKATITNRTVTRKNEAKVLLENEGLTFSNTYTEPKGSLSIKKTVNIVDNSTETPNLGTDTYPIVVTLTNGSSHITGAVTCTDSLDSNHTSVTFGSGGEATLSLKHSQTITLTGLPVGTTWTVCEGTLTNAERWDTKYKVNNVDVASASGNISAANEVDSVDITNTYDYAATPTKAEATIKVSKQYGAQTYGEPVQFTITGIDGTATPNPSSLSITGANSNQFKLTFNTAGTYTYTVSEVKGGVNGMTYAETVYTVTFNVARGTGSDCNKLVATPTYTVVEKPGATSNSYLYTDTTGLLFTNTYNPGSSEEQDKGSLSIKKTLVKPDNVTTGLPENYEIKITLSHYDGISSSSQIGSSEPQSVTLTFTGGEATYYIQAGETLTLSDLPVGTQWTVTETAQLDSTYWRTAYKVNGRDATAVSDEISAANETDAVIITNTYDPNGGEIVPGDTGTLSISKGIGEGIDPDTTFAFLIEVNGASGSYDATQNGTASTVTFENGSAAVKLKGGETLVIANLPVGAHYTVTELNADNYTVTYQGETGNIPENDAAICTVTNAQKGSSGEEEPKMASLTIYKTVGDGIDMRLSFDFSVLLTYQNQPTETRTLTVPANGSVTISDLPVGTLYAVTETTTGYTVTATNATGRIPVGGTTAAFHNALTGGGDVPGPGPGPGPNPGGDGGGTPALNRRDHYAYIIGYPDGDVHPQGNITRAEVATIFFRLLRDPVRTQYWSQTNDYPDVAFNKWYNNAISTLSNMGIICGYPDGTFRPDAPITRAELTKISAGFFSDPRVAATYDGRFSDVHGAEWYISYLMTALEEGLIEGYPDGSFRPNRPITRAETCTIVNRTLGRKPEKDHLLPESDMINWPDNINRNIWYYAQMQEATNSHDYRWTSVYSEVCEQWTAKLIERDWAALERTWSHANSAPGGEVMQ